MRFCKSAAVSISGEERGRKYRCKKRNAPVKITRTIIRIICMGSKTIALLVYGQAGRFPFQDTAGHVVDVGEALFP